VQIHIPTVHRGANTHSDPNFNLISKITNENSDDDDFLFNNSDYSPYTETDFRCSYIETNHFRQTNLTH